METTDGIKADPAQPQEMSVAQADAADAAPAAPSSSSDVTMSTPTSEEPSVGKESTSTTENKDDANVKVIVLNYGKWKDGKSMEDFLRSKEVHFHRVQKARQLSFGFIIFESQAARDAALPRLAELTWNDELMDVKAAFPKRSVKQTDSRGPKKAKRSRSDSAGQLHDDAEPDHANDANDASDVVTPWATVPYEEQLERKEAEMKKVLVKVVRRTRREFARKDKRMALEEQKRQKRTKKNDASGAETSDNQQATSANVPAWLTSHGSLYAVVDDVLYTRLHEAKDDEPWKRIIEAPNTVDTVSVGSELVAARSDQTLHALKLKDGTYEWEQLGSMPELAISLTNISASLVCCTSSGAILKQDGSGRFSSGGWKEIGRLDHLRLITSHHGGVYAYTRDDSGVVGWYKAPLTTGVEPKLEFTPITLHVEPSIMVHGMTSHDAQLILLGDSCLTYVDTEGNVVRTVPLSIADSDCPRYQSFSSHKGLICPMDAIHPSPTTEGYRNKCEFSIGLDTKGEACVGFRLGLFREGSVVVSGPEDCVNVSPVMKRVCEAVLQMIKASNFPVYDVKAHTGVWRMLTVRHSERTQELMLMLLLNAEGIPAPEYTTLKAFIVEHLTAASLPINVTSLYVQEYAGVSAPSESDPTILLHGKATIEEQLLGLRFMVSPHAFFQVNTTGAEQLYSLVKEVANADAKTLLYDVCCGTGTIGLCASDVAGKVVGIELCKSATENAAENAKLNAITNVEFINSKAEDVMKDLLQVQRIKDETHWSNVVAIVDPPRAGLHHQVLRALRSCSPVKRIVYVSCNPTGSFVRDAVILCGPKTKSVQGEPFRPVRGCPVDMFPHTPHCEMIVVFERD